MNVISDSLLLTLYLVYIWRKMQQANERQRIDDNLEKVLNRIQISNYLKNLNIITEDQIAEYKNVLRAEEDHIKTMNDRHKNYDSLTTWYATKVFKQCDHPLRAALAFETLLLSENQEELDSNNNDLLLAATDLKLSTEAAMLGRLIVSGLIFSLIIGAIVSIACFPVGFGLGVIGAVLCRLAFSSPDTIFDPVLNAINP